MVKINWKQQLVLYKNFLLTEHTNCMISVAQWLPLSFAITPQWSQREPPKIRLKLSALQQKQQFLGGIYGTYFPSNALIHTVRPAETINYYNLVTHWYRFFDLSVIYNLKVSHHHNICNCWLIRTCFTHNL